MLWGVTCHGSFIFFNAVYIPPPPENKGAVSDEHGKRLHQDISQTEKRYSGKWSPNMLAAHYWSLLRETATGEYKQQKKTERAFNDYFCSQDNV